MSGGWRPRYSRIFASNASGRSSRETAPLSTSRSSSKRRMMWRQYVTSSASTRRSDGCTLFSARWNVSSGTPPKCSGNSACSCG